MRVPSVPSGTAPSQQIMPTDANCRVYHVVISNPSAVQVWISDNQAALDASVVGGVPQVGHVIQPNSNPIYFGKVKSLQYARSSGPGASIECTAYPDC